MGKQSSSRQIRGTRSTVAAFTISKQTMKKISLNRKSGFEQARVKNEIRLEIYALSDQEKAAQKCQKNSRK